jgi:hypothetical protein
MYWRSMGEVEDLRDNAERCRRLARAVLDIETTKTLERMADEFERQARQLDEEAPVARLPENRMS